MGPSPKRDFILSEPVFSRVIRSKLIRADTTLSFPLQKNKVIRY